MTQATAAAAGQRPDAEIRQSPADVPIPPAIGGERGTDRSNARVAWAVLRRDVVRHVRSPARTLGGLVQPLLFIFVLGYGLSPVVDRVGGVEFRHFVLPGAVAISVAMTAIVAASSTVRDREHGALRGMLVAPVWRGSILLGKVAGGAAVGTLQGALVLAIAPLVGLRLGFSAILLALGICVLAGVAMAALGSWVACAARRLEGFQAVVQFALFPMVFLSGGLFPLNRLPGWLEAVTRINPLSYAVDPLRQVLLRDVAPPAELAGVSLLGGDLSVGWGIVLAAFGALVFLAGSMWELTRQDP